MGDVPNNNELNIDAVQLLIDDHKKKALEACDCGNYETYHSHMGAINGIMQLLKTLGFNNAIICQIKC